MLLWRCPRTRGGVLILLLALGGGAVAHETPAPRMDFVPPAPGSYRLPPIQPAADGEVLDSDGTPHRLAEYTAGKLTVLSLIYTYCTDPTGCPLAYHTFIDLHDRVAATPALRSRVRFVSLSFDPINDTPQTMRVYGGRYARGDGPLPWHFLTTRSLAELRPILDGFGQDVALQVDAQGRGLRTYSHMLKVFLIDRQGRVREIYTTAFLLPQVMLNDILTLAMEEEPELARTGLLSAPSVPGR